MIGFCFGRGGRDGGAADGPAWLRHWGLTDRLVTTAALDWSHMVHDLPEHSPLDALIEMSRTLSRHCADVLKATTEPLLVIGGDHSSAIGTWQGAAQATNRLGLLWVDAHLDSHTTETTHTGNLHGMPLAVLLGQGDPRLTAGMALDPSAVCVIGARDYEPEEPEMLGRLGVRVYYDDEINRRGIRAVTEEAIGRICSRCDTFGVSIDVDTIDPQWAPGVGCPSRNGRLPEEIYALIETIREHSQPIGWEIVEYNPHRDDDTVTAEIIVEMLQRITVSSENFTVVPDPLTQTISETV